MKYFRNVPEPSFVVLIVEAVPEEPDLVLVIGCYTFVNMC